MTSWARERSVAVWFQVAFPLAGTLALVAAARPLFTQLAMARWMVHPATVTGVCWAGLLWYAGRGVDVRHVVGPVWRHVFGLANVVTLLRGGLYALVAGFVVVAPTPELVWAPALCYGAGVVLDKLDGTVARTVGEQTALGRRLDMAFDTFGFVAAPVVAVLWGRLPVWYLAISAVKYVYLAGIYSRRWRGLPVFDPPESALGKYLAGVQMVFITVALVPVVPVDLVWTVAPLVLAPSLAVFARDFLFVSGRLPRY